MDAGPPRSVAQAVRMLVEELGTDPFKSRKMIVFHVFADRGLQGASWNCQMALGVDKAACGGSGAGPERRQVADIDAGAGGFKGLEEAAWKMQTVSGMLVRHEWFQEALGCMGDRALCLAADAGDADSVAYLRARDGKAASAWLVEDTHLARLPQDARRGGQGDRRIRQGAASGGDVLWDDDAVRAVRTRRDTQGELEGALEAALRMRKVKWDSRPPYSATLRECLEAIWACGPAEPPPPLEHPVAYMRDYVADKPPLKMCVEGLGSPEMGPAGVDRHVKIIKQHAGIDLHHAGLDDVTPIHCAAAVGHPVLVQALLEGAQRRIDPNKKSEKDYTALSIAAALNHYEILDILPAIPGADPTTPAENGVTPLICAAHQRSKGVFGAAAGPPRGSQHARQQWVEWAEIVSAFGASMCLYLPSDGSQNCFMIRRSAFWEGFPLLLMRVCTSGSEGDAEEGPRGAAEEGIGGAAEAAGGLEAVWRQRQRQRRRRSH
ncbi:hypothetical protein BDZ91DRAFT_800016 [Kalaharituber pfeilii]|nr:hypothetical protein BDZ91DRAFT_800016 [Kalaharituber pfeilii]